MDVKIKIRCWGKDVLVTAEDFFGPLPANADPTKVFNAVSKRVDQMMDDYKIADPEGGTKPPTATHTIVKQSDGQYRLQKIPRP